MKVTTAIDNSPAFAYRMDVSVMIVVDGPLAKPCRIVSVCCEFGSREDCL